MQPANFIFQYEVYASSDELTATDAALLNIARKNTGNAYAPYSGFCVSAVARLDNGETVAGSNQENASYPVGICAERVLLGNAATRFPGIAIETIAVSYAAKGVVSDHPISPCGMCRQSLLEYENRMQQPIRLLLSGQKGKVYLIKSVSVLLPLAFSENELLPNHPKDQPGPAPKT